MKNFVTSLLSLAFPQLCMHCHEELQEDVRLLCPSCQSLLDLLSPTGRCHTCFRQMQETCYDCLKKRPSVDFVASCFEYTGPAKSLVGAFKYEEAPFLTKSLASFLLLQFDALDWPRPDFVSSIPQTFLKKSLRGYNQSELLAREFAKLLSCTFQPLLVKTKSSFSQSLLDKEEREKLSDSFLCLDPAKLHGKTVLLIDDVFTTGSTIECATHALRQGNPSSVYALTICN